MGACASASRPPPSPQRHGCLQQPTLTWTASTRTTPIVQSAHAFTVYQHGLVKRTTATGEFVRSGTFAVGGHDWTVRYYPNGDSTDEEACRQASVVLELMTVDAAATAVYELKVVDQITGERFVLREGKTAAFDTRNSQFSCSGVQFVETPAFLAGDFLSIECIVTIFGEPRVSKTNTMPPPPPPPPPERSDVS
uniref:MATH domain-containing protein n=1 Tax=Oryza punctata TaxID=4537 RepID=A0A0E0LQW7_ORYPU